MGGVEHSAAFPNGERPRHNARPLLCIAAAGKGKKRESAVADSPIPLARSLDALPVVEHAVLVASLQIVKVGYSPQVIKVDVVAAVRVLRVAVNAEAYNP